MIPRTGSGASVGGRYLRKRLAGAIAVQILAGWALASPADDHQARSKTISGDQISVLHFERQTYPLYAKLRSISGVVILKAAIDSAGLVSAVTVLQGPEALRSDAAKNLKRWRFARPRQRDALVVYWFRISGLCEPPCESNYEFYPPNLAVISVGSQVATP